jgi:sigma-B regulation protein RsbU (phosphoserine phosphatase)
MGILPQEFPAFPEYTEFDLHVFIEPAREVGGDLYDYFMIDEHRLFLVIGDVSDKGVPAALFMAVTKTLFKTLALYHNSSIADIMTLVNRALSQENPSQMFVTVFACILDINTGTITYSDGGHDPPYVIRSGKGVEFVDKKGGPIIGICDDFQYDSGIIDLNPGDTIVFYTDGLTEAMTVDRQLFGRERLTRVLESCSADLPPSAVTEHLMTGLRSFVGGAPQSDDIAILAVKYQGKRAEKDRG